VLRSLEYLANVLKKIGHPNDNSGRRLELIPRYWNREDVDVFAISFIGTTFKG
jgi:hypothetical protein